MSCHNQSQSLDAVLAPQVKRLPRADVSQVGKLPPSRKGEFVEKQPPSWKLIEGEFATHLRENDRQDIFEQAGAGLHKADWTGGFGLGVEAGSCEKTGPCPLSLTRLHF
jgi:hypothetical protein